MGFPEDWGGDFKSSVESGRGMDIFWTNAFPDVTSVDFFVVTT